MPTTTDVFPDCLLRTPDPDPSPRILDHIRPHNRAVRAWQAELAGGSPSITRDERGFLSLLAGLEGLAGSGLAIEPFGAEYVWGPMLAAARTLLNFDRGRLSGGVLAEYLDDLSRRVGIDPYTEVWVGPHRGEPKATRAPLTERSRCGIHNELLVAGRCGSCDLADRPPRYSLAELDAMPTLHQGQYDNLKAEPAGWKVWLSRVGKDDGMPGDNVVTVERLVNGVWTTFETYEARP